MTKFDASYFKLITKKENQILADIMVNIFAKIKYGSNQLKPLISYFKSGIDCTCQSYELFGSILSLSEKILKLRKFPNRYRYFEIYGKEFFINGKLIQIPASELSQIASQLKEDQARSLNEFCKNFIELFCSSDRSDLVKIWPESKSESIDQPVVIVPIMNHDLIDQVWQPKFSSWSTILKISSLSHSSRSQVS